MTIQLKQTYPKILTLFFMIFISCSNQEHAPGNTNTEIISPTSSAPPTLINPSAAEPSITQTAEFNETSTITITPSVTNSVTTEPRSTPTVATLEARVLEECPILIESGQDSPILFEGTILFGLGWMIPNATSSYLIDEGTGIWGISSSNSDVTIISEEISSGIISPEATMIFNAHSIPDTPVHEATFYNLLSGEIKVVEFETELGPFTSVKWLPDGRLQYTTNIEQTLEVGEEKTGFIIDPVSGESEPFAMQLNLPDYTFDPTEINQGVPSGFAVVDPQNELVLYTARNGNDNSHEVRLLNLLTGEVVWQTRSNSFGSRNPKWSLDGENVLFTIYEPTEGTPYGWTRLISLDRYGVEEELPPQPFPKIWKDFITSWSRSPDDNYIFFAVREDHTLHSYILDTETWIIKEICDPNVIDFVRDTRYLAEVYWAGNEYLIYRVVVEKDGEPTHSLRILDIANWTTQVLFEPDSGYGINLSGWIPFELH